MENIRKEIIEEILKYQDKAANMQAKFLFNTLNKNNYGSFEEIFVSSLKQDRTNYPRINGTKEEQKEFKKLLEKL